MRLIPKTLQFSTMTDSLDNAGDPMDRVKHLISTCAVRCIGLAKILKRKIDWKIREELAPETESVESFSLREWTTVLVENARIFNGLYSGLARVQGGSAKRPEKVLREWCQRTHYKFENQPVDLLCREHIISLIETADKDELMKWASLLLDAAVAAGITKEAENTLVLTEANADAYVEWDGDDLYAEDQIEVILPAWYQNGKLLEQGQCRKINLGNTSEGAGE